MDQIVSTELCDGVAIVTIDNPPVNAIGRRVRQELLEVFKQLSANTDSRAVVLCGAGKCFVAGADITEFGKPPEQPFLPEVCNTIEDMPVPVVASLHGVSLGGGLELALAAHYRVAHRTSQMGLPEVHLGLIPGAGGTQRLPRLVGVQKALHIITTGRRIDAETARQMGLVDMVTDNDASVAGLEYARGLIASGDLRRPTRDKPRPDPIDWEAAQAEVAGDARGRIAPLEALKALRASTEMEFAEGLSRERDIFTDLMKTDQRQALIHAFFAERAVGKQPEPSGVGPYKIEKIGVVGGGTMGAGIATSALLAGLSVTLVEVSSDRASAAREQIARYIEGAVRRGKLAQHTQRDLLDSKLSVTEHMQDLAASDIVIEAVLEEMGVKKDVFMRLDKICRSDTVLASNTSYLDINEIADGTTRAEKVIGLHFFSPAHVMKLLEVVVPNNASAQTVAAGFALARRLGKTAVRSGVCEGFIGNRLLNACRTAVDHMVLDGASPFQIDDAMVAFGYLLGPFQVSDLAGLDIGWAMRKRLAPTRSAHERVGRYPDVLCEAGHFGRKTGKGFYIYEKDRAGMAPNMHVLDIIETERSALGLKMRAFSFDEIQRRYMAAMVNEAARLLDEGIAQRPLDVDVVLMAGYAFPRHMGGPCKWADLNGLAPLLADIRRFAGEDAHFWQPAPSLERLVDQGLCFDDLNATV